MIFLMSKCLVFYCENVSETFISFAFIQLTTVLWTVNAQMCYLIFEA